VEVDRLLDTIRSFRTAGSGIRHWSVMFSESRGLTLGIKDREVGNPHAPLSLAESSGASYRLIWDDGLVSVGSLERRQLRGDPSEALEYARMAAYDDPDAAWVRGPAPMPDVEMYDDAAAALARGETGLLTDRLSTIRRRLAGRKFKTWSGSFFASEGVARLVTSAGLDDSSDGTTAGWHVAINGEAGDGFSARCPEPGGDFEARIDRLLETAARLERPGPAMEAGARRVLLSPGVVEAYVLGILLTNLAGSKVAHGEGHFRREQFGSGETVLREDIDLRLDPLQPLRAGTYRCTSEGVPASRCAYIESGKLVHPILGLKYARRLGLEPTPLPWASDTLFFGSPERVSRDRALADVSDGVLVLSVLGAHTQDPASGDFSLSAPQALAIVGGALDGRLRGTISGNIFELLRSDDLRFVAFEGEHMPGLLLTCRFDPPEATQHP
jgi:PmbA protein